MKINSHLADRKIRGVNIGADLTIGEYNAFLPSIIEKNGYQRNRVKTSGKTYELLREDLIAGCVIPPIILAISEIYEDELRSLILKVMDNASDQASWDQIDTIVKKAISNRDVIILDGLQRSLTILSIVDSAQDIAPEKYENFINHPIRVEIYAGLSKPGILYRMLTLNTGQTPMSFRHQLEILYDDYVDSNQLPDGIRILKETDESRARGESRYRYADVIDMFYAYNMGSPMPYNRQALVTDLRELDFLEGFSAEAGADEMKSLLVLYNTLIRKVAELSGDWHPSPEDEGGVTRPFAPNITSAFARNQPMTGFGAECKRLIKTGSIASLSDIEPMIGSLHFSDEVGDSLDNMTLVLDQIAKRAKRIGDAQRIYFQLVFRALFQPESDSRYDLSLCWIKAQESYELLHA